LISRSKGSTGGVDILLGSQNISIRGVKRGVIERLCGFPRLSVTLTGECHRS
jgi:hypothetical protein